ncbi:NAD(P)/FAD-dependent oxidoreductase [Nocardioides zeae]|uniref:NAD(P)/FAD-dependent oxidoreductase n=1 Tax=Nocardioides imazamoxiresistens TaxID=3231893 RepID=A0ABU3Q1G9_9ACTN|nr:NAD(P)/FAD-dependent oxidoreductase [Nocardioides zeae]MDT9595189.1 NAD(P)/FAD-dependent oxidoreductase [Nocardioides zeae]
MSDPTGPAAPTDGTESPLHAVVVGAGFAGIAAALALREVGVEVVVLERADDVGGVWRDNTYPGAACDVPSALYSYSFDSNPGWRRVYSEQPDILAYLRDVVERRGLRPLVRTGTTVTAAAYDDASGRWTVATLRDGTVGTLETDLVVPAVGQLSEPVVPALPGLGSFAGPAFHSATWRHDVDLRGRHVAVVGTGASAIQLVPRVADVAASVTVFQRSAPYVVPKADGRYPAVLRSLLRRCGPLRRLERGAYFRLTEWLNGALTGELAGSRLPAALLRVWRAHLRLRVKDPALRARLLPSDPIGCKRLLFSNDWYAALDRPHVDVVTAGVARVEADALVDDDGRRHRADVVVWGTGFAAADFLAGVEVTGRDGVRLADVWAGGAHAHLGVTVPGFPGLAMMYGPNTNLGGSSIIGMLEPQAAWVAQLAVALRRARARGVASLDVAPDVAAAYDAEMQDRLARSVWAGCVSWYRTAAGRITTNWPGTVREYQQRLATLDVADLEEVTAWRTTTTSS